MSFKTKTPVETSVTPYEAYNLMLTDYVDTKDGLLPPTNIEESQDIDSGSSDLLRQLRSSLGYYALTEAQVPLEQLANDLGMKADVLVDELERDERLIELTQTYKKRFEHPEIADSATSTIIINRQSVRWISKHDSITLNSEKVQEGEMSYRFVDLTALNRTTAKAREHVKKDGKLDAALDYIKHQSIPQLEQAIMSGGGGYFRPVQDIGTNDRDRTVQTDFPAYKFGVNGTEYRAVLLLLGKNDTDGLQQYGLASICDHDDQEAVIRALSQNNVSSK